MLRRAVVPSLLFILLVPATTWGCTCSQAPPGKCPGLQKDDVVFLGMVTDIEILPVAASSPAGESPANAAGMNPSVMPITHYHFRVDERFAGADASELDIFSGGDDGDCGYRFKKGEQYVVFTQQDTEGRLFATICNGTRAAAEARALLPQLRAMRNGQRVASVFGVLRRADPPTLAPTDDPDEPLPHIKLKLRSRYDRFATSTDANGVYSFYDVHAGEYSFTANLPSRMELTQKTLFGPLPMFKIPNGACYEYNVDALPTGHIQGGVLGPEGKPLKIASVELYRADRYEDSRPGLWGFQGAKGVFDFDHIGPGEYILVFNRVNRMDPNSPFPRAFYPGVSNLSDAKVIRLKDGQQLTNVKIRLKQGYPARQLTVRLKWKDGKPRGEVYVTAKADQGDNPAAQKIGDDAFQFTLLESANYTISAWVDLDPARVSSPAGDEGCPPRARIDASPVTVSGSDPATKEITLTFISPECAK